MTPKGKYAVRHQPSKAPDKSKPWCVINLDTGAVNGRWHATEQEAKDQLKAMYANMGDGAYMHHELNYLAPLKKFSDKWIDGNKLWVQLYPYDTWTHPYYGDTTVDEEVARKFVENFESGVRGTELHSDYEHGIDPAKGTKASGKFIKVEAREDGPWALVQFTEEAKKEIDAGEWNYWSTSHYDTWTHPHTQEEYEYVLDGGGLTNKPWVKGIVPLNFSELMIENPDLKMHAVLSSSDRNNLPDSAFAYIESGGKKDAEGKTVPRSKRHLPYKTADGKIDLAHVRNALARLAGTQIPDSVKPNIRAKLQRALAAQHSETVLDILEAIPENQFVIDDETEEWVRDEFDLDETTTDEEGMNELLKKFSEKLGLEEDADEDAVLNAVSELVTEITPLRELKAQREEKKQFSELFPEQAKELEEARAYREEQEAKRFAESLVDRRVTHKVKGENDDETKDEPSGLGLSALAIERAGDVVKKFSEGSVKVEDFKEFTDTLFDNGIVDYGTRGSSRENEEEEEPKQFSESTPVRELRKQFSERIQKLADDEFEGDFNKAYVEAQERWPNDFEAYKTRKPVMAVAQ